MGLLDGGLARIVGSALIKADLSIPVTLSRVTRGGLGATVTAAPTETTTSHGVRGVRSSLDRFVNSGGLVADANSAVSIYAVSLPSGVTPAPGDRLVVDGETVTIAQDEGGRSAVTTDGAKVMYHCQCR